MKLWGATLHSALTESSMPDQLFVCTSYPRSPNLCLEAVVDCVGKPWIFFQCSCLIAPLRGYGSALWRTRMLLPNAGRKIADWLLRGFIQCANIQVIITWSIRTSVHKFRGCEYDDGTLTDVISCAHGMLFQCCSTVAVENHSLGPLLQACTIAVCCRCWQTKCYWFSFFSRYFHWYAWMVLEKYFHCMKFWWIDNILNLPPPKLKELQQNTTESLFLDDDEYSCLAIWLILMFFTAFILINHCIYAYMYMWWEQAWHKTSHVYECSYLVICIMDGWGHIKSACFIHPLCLHYNNAFMADCEVPLII